MTNVYIGIVNDIADKYNNAYGTINMKPIDVQSSTYIELIKIVDLKLVRSFCC